MLKSYSRLNYLNGFFREVQKFSLLPNDGDSLFLKKTPSPAPSSFTFYAVNYTILFMLKFTFLFSVLNSVKKWFETPSLYGNYQENHERGRICILLQKNANKGIYWGEFLLHNPRETTPFSRGVI